MNEATQTQSPPVRWYLRPFAKLGAILLTVSTGVAVAVVADQVKRDSTKIILIQPPPEAPRGEIRPPANPPGTPEPPPAVGSDHAPTRQSLPDIPLTPLQAGAVTIKVPTGFRHGDQTQYPVEGVASSPAWLVVLSRSDGAADWYLQDARDLLADPKTVKFTWPLTVTKAQVRIGLIPGGKPSVPELGRRLEPHHSEE